MVCLYQSMPPKNDSQPLYPELVAVKFDPSTETANLTETLWLRSLAKKFEEEAL